MKFALIAKKQDPDDDIVLELDGIAELVEFTQKCAELGYTVIVKMLKEEEK